MATASRFMSRASLEKSDERIDTTQPPVVTLTFPDGRVQKFEMVLAPSCQALSPLVTLRNERKR